MRRNRDLTRLGLSALLAMQATSALAHEGTHDHAGFAYGFMHPLGGLDHILAMVAVGVLAASIGGRALWAVPLSFVALMIFGGLLGMAGVAVPFVELGIALSIVVFGLALIVGRDWPVAAAMALVGAFAVFHGVAHGAEMPADASGVSYAAGFVAATALLHLAGIAVGLALGEIGRRTSPRPTQLGGAAVALAGLMVLTGLL
jgi:urease accessory protein